MSCLCCENSNNNQWALTVTSGAIYWTIKRWTLKKTVGVKFIKLWYIINIVINNYIVGKILEFFRNFLGKFSRPTSLAGCTITWRIYYSATTGCWLPSESNTKYAHSISVLFKLVYGRIFKLAYCISGAVRSTNVLYWLVKRYANFRRSNFLSIVSCISTGRGIPGRALQAQHSR